MKVGGRERERERERQRWGKENVLGCMCIARVFKYLGMELQKEEKKKKKKKKKKGNLVCFLHMHTYLSRFPIHCCVHATEINIQKKTG